MEIVGSVVSLLPQQTGAGKNGQWKKQEFVIETPGQYPKKVCLSLWGDKVDECPLSIGDKITASINIESREYNGRWFTDVRAWKLVKNSTPVNDQANNNDQFNSDTSGSDDLPF